jgi:hypothetical protein
MDFISPATASSRVTGASDFRQGEGVLGMLGDFDALIPALKTAVGEDVVEYFQVLGNDCVLRIGG